MDRIFILRTLSQKYQKSMSDIVTLIKNKSYISKDYFKEINIGNRVVINKGEFLDEDRLVLEYYQHLLKDIYCVKFKNRDVIINELLDIMPHLFLYKQVTLYKFDFKDFFRSVEISKVLEIFSSDVNLLNYEYNFLYTTYSNLERISPGLGIHNILVEILGVKFDQMIEAMYKDDIIYYNRYVDDGILILNSILPEISLKNKIYSCAKDFFGLNMRFNDEKVGYLKLPSSNQFNKKITYLGYSFSYCYKPVNRGNQKEQKIFRFGIASEKLEKEKLKVNNIINNFQINLNQKLLEKKIDIFFKRIVLYDKVDRCWKNFGFSTNYKQIKKLITYNSKENTFCFENLEEETIKFLKLDFLKEHSYYDELPNQLKSQIIRNKFVANLFHNRSIILHSKIGLNYNELSKYLEDCNILIRSSDSYEKLLRRFMGCLIEKSQ